MTRISQLWNDKMALGEPMIDDHHQTLLRLILETRDTVQNGSSFEVVKKLISALKSYAKYHFKAEERFMFSRGYPGLEAHRELHKGFISRIDDFENRFSENPLQVNVELLWFLGTWFTGHILNADKKIMDSDNS